MKIIDTEITIAELTAMQENFFGDMVKGVVDLRLGVLAVDAELHADLESLLLSEGSRQQDLWGINLFPEMEGEDMVEFDSMINIRPWQNNYGRGVDSEETRDAIMGVINRVVK